MAVVEVRHSGDLESADRRHIRRLLDSAFDGGFSADDWEHMLGGRHVLVRDGSALVAHAAVVLRTLWVGPTPFATGYIEGVATVPAHHGRGLGSLAMLHAGRLVRDDFELGALSTDRWSFYARLGWERWQGPTYVRSVDGSLTRTPDEDDGVMVLRFGRSLDIDLSSSLTCQDRPGDAW